mgnify:CR=1 FL=1
MGNIYWTTEETNRLKQIYPIFTNKFIGVLLGRTEKAIKRKGQDLDLRKELNPSHFTKGYTPHNKGSKGRQGEETRKHKKELRIRYKKIMLDYGLSV